MKVVGSGVVAVPASIWTPADGLASATIPLAFDMADYAGDDGDPVTAIPNIGTLGGNFVVASGTLKVSESGERCLETLYDFVTNYGNFYYPANTAYQSAVRYFWGTRFLRPSGVPGGSNSGCLVSMTRNTGLDYNLSVGMPPSGSPAGSTLGYGAFVSYNSQTNSYASGSPAYAEDTWNAATAYIYGDGATDTLALGLNGVVDNSVITGVFPMIPAPATSTIQSGADVALGFGNTNRWKRWIFASLTSNALAAADLVKLNNWLAS